MMENDNNNSSEDETIIDDSSTKKSCDSITMSSNSSISSDEYERQLPKRYKLPLYSDYKPSDVCRLTKQNWKQKSEAYLKSYGNMSLGSTSTAAAALPVDEINNIQEFSNSDSENSNAASVHNDQYENVITMEKECNDNIRTNQCAYQDHSSFNLLEGNKNLNVSSLEAIKNGIGSIKDYYPFEMECNNEGTSEKESEHDEERFFSLSDDDDLSADSESDETDSFEDDDAEVPIKNKSYFNQIMFAESGLTVRDVIIMITAFSLKVNLHDEAKLKLAEMVKILAGKRYSKLNLSKYMMNECFSAQEENVTYHFYCTHCTKTILYAIKANEQKRYKEGFCNDCKKKLQITKSSSNYFLSLNLKYQIEQLLSNPILRNDIFDNLKSEKVDNEIYEDVYSGSLHKNIIHNSNSKSEYILTVNVNIDGAPLTKSGKTGFWPVQIVLNNLSPKLRFKNVLVSGLFLTSTEPKSNLLNLYLEHVYVKQIESLYEGVEIVYNNRIITLKFCTHAFIVDAVARAIVQNRIQFNGYYGCSFCYQLGEYIASVHGIRYPVTQDGKERTNESHMEDVKMSKFGKICNGVKGPCVLEKLPFYDMVWSFPYEYLHAMLLGPTLTVLNEWRNGNSEFQLSKALIDVIEKRFLHITPTSEIHRLPRSGILKGTAKPKASELKSWLLFYSLPCLSNILKEEALDHFSLLVKCAYKLLTTTVTNEDLNECELDLMTFVINYAKLYGEDKITYNIHILLHIIDSIRKSGPIYCNSAFPFESNIHNLKTFVSGPNCMDRQIARKYLQFLLFRTENIEKLTSSQETSNFCSTLFNPTRLSKSFRHASEVSYCGKSEMKEISGFGIYPVYKKCIYKGTVFHSKEYKQAKKTDNSIVQIQSGEYGQIMKIVDCNNESYFQLRFYKLFSNDPFKNVYHIKKIESECSVTFLRPITDVKCKVMLINVRNGRYLSHLPNTFEIQ